MKKAREWFRKLENGDEEALALWQWFRDESLSGIQPPLQWIASRIWQLQRRSLYNDKMDAVVDILAEKGLCWVREPRCQSWRNMELNIQPLSKNLMVQLSISHVTWLQPLP